MCDCWLSIYTTFIQHLYIVLSVNFHISEAKDKLVLQTKHKRKGSAYIFDWLWSISENLSSPKHWWGHCDFFLLHTQHFYNVCSSVSKISDEPMGSVRTLFPKLTWSTSKTLKAAGPYAFLQWMLGFYLVSTFLMSLRSFLLKINIQSQNYLLRSEMSGTWQEDAGEAGEERSDSLLQSTCWHSRHAEVCTKHAHTSLHSLLSVRTRETGKLPLFQVSAEAHSNKKLFPGSEFIRTQMETWAGATVDQFLAVESVTKAFFKLCSRL